MLTLQLVTVVAVLTGCDAGQTPTTVNADPTLPRASSSPCVKGKPVKVRGTVIPKRCPDSQPREIGFSQQLDLGSVLADLPCRELPDFAGSFWRASRPYPKRLAMVGHDNIPGKMTLVTEDEALFTAKAIRMHMGPRSDPPMRFPAKGNLALTFERVHGSAAVGGCD
jgi:hypothetical protein